MVVISTALAALLAARDSTLVWLSAVGVTGTSVMAYVLSRSVGLPQIGGDVGSWLDPLGTAALSLEALTIILALWVLGARTTPANRGLVVQRSR